MPGRVLHLLSQRPAWTGSGVALEAIARRAAQAGWRQQVVVGTSPDDPRPSVGGLAEADIHPLLFPQPGLEFALPGMSDVMPYASSRFADLNSAQLTAYRRAWRDHVRPVVEEFRPHVIHSHHVWLLSGLVKDLAPHVPVVTHCHGTGLRQLVLCPHLADEVLAGCRRNEAFLALHQEQAGKLCAALRVPAERVEVIGSGFPDDVFHDRGRQRDCGPVLLYAGKLSAAKGLPWLIDAVELLAGQMPYLHLHVAGSGAGDDAERIRRRLEASPRITFHGQVNQSQLAGLMRQSAVFVLPSFYEGLPLVLVEAAACGCRLVATSLPGVVEQLQPLLGESLETVDLPRLAGIDQPVAEDLPSFVQRLARAIERSLQLSPLEHAGRQVAGLTWTAVFERIDRVWQRVMETVD
ncbi:MAG: glycosyltransferase family 4 protein [Pirellulaceae bacterium]|nr:glycosyltransferase family 4 protein [Pirellulaceae bacterium]